MKKINISKTHLIAIIFWIAALLIDRFFKNNSLNSFSFYLLAAACMLWYISLANDVRKTQKSLHDPGYHSLLMLSSLVIMLAAYCIMFVRLELKSAIIVAWIGNIAMASAAILIHREAKRSSD